MASASTRMPRNTRCTPDGQRGGGRVVADDGVHDRAEDRDADGGADRAGEHVRRGGDAPLAPGDAGLGDDQGGCGDPAHPEADQQAARARRATASRPGPSGPAPGSRRRRARRRAGRSPGSRCSGRAAPTAPRRPASPRVRAASAKPLTIAEAPEHVLAERRDVGRQARGSARRRAARARSWSAGCRCAKTHSGRTGCCDDPLDEHERRPGAAPRPRRSPGSARRSTPTTGRPRAGPGRPGWWTA